jgi:DNA-binding NarL/FixJ family response regulator
MSRAKSRHTSRTGLSELRAAFHDFELEEGQWLAEIFARTRPLLDEGAGLFVYSYRLDREAIRLTGLEGEHTAPRFWSALSRWGADNQGAIAALYEPRAEALSESVRRTKASPRPLSDYRGAFEPEGVRDLVAVVGHDALGAGVILAAPRVREVAIRHTERRWLDRLAAELGALTRLRARRRTADMARLSASEALVLRRILEGASDKDMARELGCGLSSVSTFARRLRRKLGCRPGEESLLLSAPRSTEALSVRLELFDRLSSAECDVLSALLVGARYQEVARWRRSSTRTVASQVASIFRKARVSGRRELAAKLLR